MNRSGAYSIDDTSAFIGWFLTASARPATPHGSGWVSHPDAAQLGTDSVIGYCGYVFNHETADYTVRFRHYSPSLGRWLERDPLPSAIPPYAYLYVDAGPLKYSDPLGLENVCGLRVLLLTTRWCEDREIVDGASNTYCQAVWDRTNGVLDGITFQQVDLGDLAGIDWTFDPDKRARAECFAKCVGDTLVNSVIPGIPPGFSIQIFDRSGQWMRGILGFSWNPADVAPSSLELIGNYLEKKFKLQRDKWKMVCGRTSDGVKAVKGVDRTQAGRRLSKLGGRANLGKFVWDVFVGCDSQCADVKCSKAGGTGGP